MPLYERRSNEERDDHLLPPERRHLELSRTLAQVEALPPGAIPLSEVEAKLNVARPRVAARDHARWCDAPKVLASYELAGRLDIAADPIEQAARRWLADPAAVIVVADQDQEQLVRDAVARLRQPMAEAAPGASTPQRRHPSDGIQVDPT